MGVVVLLVTFSTAGYGRVWLEEVCKVFSLLIDREREVYARYDLKRSVLRSWNLKTLALYKAATVGAQVARHQGGFGAVGR